MRQYLTLARKHGAKKFEVILGPDISVPDHLKAFKKNRASRINEDFAEIQLWQSDGRRLSADFITSKEAKEIAHAAEVAEKKAAESQAKVAAESKKIDDGKPMTQKQLADLAKSKQERREQRHQEINAMGEAVKPAAPPAHSHSTSETKK